MIDAARKAVWPERLLHLALSLNGPNRAEARGDFWLLLNMALTQRLRLHSWRLGPVDVERIHDLASEKALDLVGRIDSGRWNPLDSSAGELVNFISTIARNTLVDELRRSGRHKAAPLDEMLDRHQPAGDQDPPGASAERREFISSLTACAERLKPEHRIIWLFRILYEMPIGTIADHPDVRLKTGNVNMILARSRNQIRRCMRSKGLQARELPPGTFAELWRTFRVECAPEAAHD